MERPKKARIVKRRERYAGVRDRHKELHNLQEKDVWRWYWKVRFTPEYLRTQKKSKLWQYYDYLLHNEQFPNLRSGYIIEDFYSQFA